MREILEQILNSEQIAKICLWLNTTGPITGKVVYVNDEIVILSAFTNSISGRYWTTAVRISAIEVIDFRSDTRPLTEEEVEDMDNSVEEEENTSE
jgi:ClpP class serine protease